jgi:ComF family protein
VPPFVSRWADLRARLAAVERWILPGECLICRAPVEPDPRDPLVCGPCRSRWLPLPEPQCARCGQPVSLPLACRLCAAWPPGLSGVRSAVWLDAGARRAVHLLKYEGWWRLSEALAVPMRRLLSAGAPVTLIPIPLGATRQRARGYNQSGVLANALGRLLGVPVVEHALRRRRDTATQTALTPEERRANLSGAFVAVGKPPRRPVLVDDVFTTGATLVEAANALVTAGAPSVEGVTFARAPRPLADAEAAPII